MTRKFGIAALLIVAICVGTLFAADSDTLRVTFRAWDYDTLDPHVTNFTQVWWMLNIWTDTLVRQDDDGSFSRGLAESWEAQDSGKTWIFYLREGVTFHDGTPWNADAMIANIDRVLDPETKSKQFADIFADIASYEAVDAMTVKLVYTTPKATLLQMMAASVAGWISPTAFNNPDNTEPHELFVGTGPWVLKREIRGQQIEWSANPDYTWGPDFAEHQGAPYIENIVFSFIIEDETRLTALLTGETDFIVEVPTTQVEILQSNPNFYVILKSRPGAAQQHHFNTLIPPTNELAVRQACIYATDQEAIVKAAFQGVHPAAYGLLMPAAPYYNSDINYMYPYNPDKARELLESAGWVDTNGDGVREKNGMDLEIEFVSFPGFMAEGPAEMVQAFYAEVGIKYNITVTTGSEMMSSCAACCPGEWNCCVVGSSGIDTIDRLYRFAHSDMIGTSNYVKYEDAELDRLIDVCRTTTDEAEREAAAKLVQVIWNTNALSNPLFAIANVFGVSNRIEGIRVEIGGAPIFYDAKVVE
ncbi:ABC transporter substrate-binding protein [Candidatus Bipolaricaulota bacterium]